MPQPILQVQDLKVAFATEDGYRPAVDGVNLTLNKGETLVLLGESGCGKSLTSLSIMQLLPPSAKIMGTEAKILFHGQDLFNLPEVQMREIRGARIAMIFQEPMTALNPVFTIAQQLTEILKLHTRISRNKRWLKMLSLMNEVGLVNAEHVLKSYPHQLSGGMKQRVMIAMAIACEPEVLIADEPTSALDVTVQAQILTLLKNLQRKNNMAMLMITHDLGVVQQVADRVAVMYAGTIIEKAPSQDFFQAPKHPYSQKLFESVPGIHNRNQNLAVIPGMVPVLTEDFQGCRFASRCQYVMPKCHDKIPKWHGSVDKGVLCHLYQEHGYDDMHATPPLAKAETIAHQNKLASNETLLSLNDVRIHFPIQKGIFKRTVGHIKAVDGVSFELQKGQTLALVGESGCGKTTLAKGVLRLERHCQGDIQFLQQDLLSLRGKRLQSFRSLAQIVFQDPFSSMNPRMLVGDIIAEGMRSLKLVTSQAQCQQELQKLIQQVGLPADSLKRYPHEFSGGQRQRIAIARALAVKPELIVCDEPTSALDVSVQAQILNLLKKLQHQHGLSYLFITHNIAVVAYMADVIAVMRQGKIVEMGPAEQILTTPEHEYTKTLLAAVPEVEV